MAAPRVDREALMIRNVPGNLSEDDVRLRFMQNPYEGVWACNANRRRQAETSVIIPGQFFINFMTKKDANRFRARWNARLFEGVQLRMEPRTLRGTQLPSVPSERHNAAFDARIVAWNQRMTAPKLASQHLAAPPLNTQPLVLNIGAAISTLSNQVPLLRAPMAPPTMASTPFFAPGSVPQPLRSPSVSRAVAMKDPAAGQIVLPPARQAPTNSSLRPRLPSPSPASAQVSRPGPVFQAPRLPGVLQAVPIVALADPQIAIEPLTRSNTESSASSTAVTQASTPPELAASPEVAGIEGQPCSPDMEAQDSVYDADSPEWEFRWKANQKAHREAARERAALKKSEVDQILPMTPKTRFHAAASAKAPPPPALPRSRIPVSRPSISGTHSEQDYYEETHTRWEAFKSVVDVAIWPHHCTTLTESRAALPPFKPLPPPGNPKGPEGDSIWGRKVQSPPTSPLFDSEERLYDTVFNHVVEGRVVGMMLREPGWCKRLLREKEIDGGKKEEWAWVGRDVWVRRG